MKLSILCAQYLGFILGSWLKIYIDLFDIFLGRTISGLLKMEIDFHQR